MVEGTRVEARQVLAALASMAPTGASRTAQLGSVPLEWFHWLGVSAVDLMAYPPEWGNTPKREIPAVIGEALASVDQIRPELHSLRLGWLFLAGPVEVDGKVHQIFLPLYSVPVRATDLPSRFERYVNSAQDASLQRVGDVDVVTLVDDADVVTELLENIPRVPAGYGLPAGRPYEGAGAALQRLPNFRREVLLAAHRAGFPATEVVVAHQPPTHYLSIDHPVVVAAPGVYALDAPVSLGRAGSLWAWCQRDLRRPTAFHALYLPETLPPDEALDVDDPVESPYVLGPDQRAVVRASRTRRVTVVSGGPGTGKSQAVVAMACEAVARGGSVLVTSKSEASVDALIELFERAPGPDPVVFGSNERRDALAQKLSQGQIAPVLAEQVATAGLRVASATRQRDQLRAALIRKLRIEAIRDGSSIEPARCARFAPHLFEGVDLARAGALLLEARAESGFLTRRRSRRAAADLRRLAGADHDVELDELGEALEVARLLRQGALGTLGGEHLELVDELWAHLLDAEAAVHRSVGEWMAAVARSEDRLNIGTLPTLSALGTALRSGRGVRRAQLERIGGDQLTRALPLWVGTLGDIEDLLPPTPGLFDLVVIDEASCIEQPLAAPALLRARRAVVVGDPRQLRHTSFLSGEQITHAVTNRGIPADSVLAVRLDARRNSVFDVAAGVSPVIELAEHHRCAPPLLEVVAERLYDGALLLATRNPVSEARRAVSIDRTDDEVTRVMAHLRRLLREQARSVAVVSPLRAQVEAIEARVLAELSLRELDALDLRIGTVHGLQGNERDTVIISLGLDAASSANRWRFVLDPHLLAVMLTRARSEVILVHAADPPVGSLLAEYVIHATDGTPHPAGHEPGGRGWRGAIGVDLAAAGHRVRADYPVGRHQVDLCVGGPDGFCGVMAGVHPDGPVAHLERQLELLRQGWPLVEAFAGANGDRRAELVVELVAHLEAVGVTSAPGAP